MANKDDLLRKNAMFPSLITYQISDENSSSLLSKYPSQISPENQPCRPLSLGKATDIIRRKPNEADNVVQTLLSQKCRGGSESFLALIDLLQSKKEYELALSLNIHALSFLQKNGNLYATQIELLLQCCGALFASEKVQKTIEENYESCWTPRFCRAVCTFYWELAKDSEESKRAEIVKAGLLCAKDLQEKEPTSEWGYYWEVKLLRITSPREAETKLEQYVLRSPGPLREYTGDNHEELCCPRCCEMYIKTVLSRRVKLFELMIELVANKGLHDTKAMKLGELTPAEKEAASGLLAYFKDVKNMIEKWKNEAKAFDRLNKARYEEPFAEMFRKNVMESPEEYKKIKFDEEGTYHG